MVDLIAEQFRVHAGLVRECYAAGLSPEVCMQLKILSGRVVAAHDLMQRLILEWVKLGKNSNETEMFAFVDKLDSQYLDYQGRVKRILETGTPSISDAQLMPCSSAFQSPANSAGVQVFGVTFASHVEATLAMLPAQQRLIVAWDGKASTTQNDCVVSGRWPDVDEFRDRYMRWIRHNAGWDSISETIRTILKNSEPTPGEAGRANPNQTETEPSAKDGENSPINTDDRYSSLPFGEDNLQLYNLLRDSAKTADDRMASAIQMDRRCVGWNSARWATYLGVTANAVRQTTTWKIIKATPERF